jgi:hypothetical protein
MKSNPMNKEGQNQFTKPRDGVPFNDAVMNQYVLDAVASAPEAIYKALDWYDKNLINKISATTLEQKLYLLGKLGKRFAFVIADRGKVSRNPDSIISFLDWCRRKFLSLSGDTLRQWGLFVRGDKELIQHLSRLSIDTTPKTMYLLRNYEEIAEGIDRVTHVQLRTAIAEQTSNMLDHWVFKVLSYYRHLPLNLKSKFGITQQNLPLLFYLINHKERLIAPIEMAMHFNSDRQTIQKYCMPLVESGILQHELLTTEAGVGEMQNAFQLTGYGITVINMIREQIVSHKP